MHSYPSLFFSLEERREEFRMICNLPLDMVLFIVYNANTFELIWPELATTAIILSGLFFTGNDYSCYNTVAKVQMYHLQIIE